MDNTRFEKKNGNLIYRISKPLLAIAAVISGLCALGAFAVHVVVDQYLYRGTDLSQGPTSIMLFQKYGSLSYTLGSAGKAAIVFTVCVVLCLTAFLILKKKKKPQEGNEMHPQS